MFFGLIATRVAAIALAALPKSRPYRRQFSDRFLYFLWRYCMPVRGFQEVIFRAAPFVDGEAGELKQKMEEDLRVLRQWGAQSGK
jgi:hypothetical protein